MKNVAFTRISLPAAASFGEDVFMVGYEVMEMPHRDIKAEQAEASLREASN